MRFYFPQYFNSKSRFLTYQVVKKELERQGHEVVNSEHGSDAVIVSMCDVLDYHDLVKIRKSTSIPLIVGGHFAYNYWSAIIYSDYVWIGEIFDFAKCKNLSEIMENPACYDGKKKSLSASHFIEWSKVPVCQITRNKAYYWGGVGCRNKCKFCFTSWTHPHQNNKRARIENAKRESKNRKVNLMVVSNEYDVGVEGGNTIDMLLKNYLQAPVKARVVRCGIEFATEETRRRLGKPITNNDIYKALQKMNHDEIMFRWFHITGYDNREDYEKYIDMLSDMLGRTSNKKLLHLMFNNIQYQNYTPLYEERRKINPENYTTSKDTRRWYDKLRQYSKHVLVGAPSPFQHVACRMGVELSWEKQQVDFWLKKLKNAKNKLTVEQAYNALYKTQVLDCCKREIDFASGEIKEVGQVGR